MPAIFSTKYSLSDEKRIIFWYTFLHFLTGYEGTFIVPKVPTIVRGNSKYNSWYRGDNKSAITRISSLFIVFLAHLAIGHVSFCHG